MKLSNKQLLLTKLETTYSTDPTPAAVNAMQVWNLTTVPMVADMKTRDRAFPNFGASPQSPSQVHRTIAFDVETAGSGAAGTAPLYGPQMRACGMSETITADTKVDYAPISGGFESCTNYHFIDGLKHVSVGTRGTMTGSFQGGELPTLHFDMTGFYAPLADAAFPAGWAAQLGSFVDSVEVNKANTAFSILGFEAVLQQLTFTQGNTVAYRDRPNAASVDITNRASTGQVSFEMTSVADFDVMQQILSTTTGALTITHGATAGNIVIFNAPAVQLISPTYTKDGDTLLVQANLSFTRTLGDDEWKWTVQ